MSTGGVKDDVALDKAFQKGTFGRNLSDSYFPSPLIKLLSCVDPGTRQQPTLSTSSNVILSSTMGRLKPFTRKLNIDTLGEQLHGMGSSGLLFVNVTLRNPIFFTTKALLGSTP